MKEKKENIVTVSTPQFVSWYEMMVAKTVADHNKHFRLVHPPVFRIDDGNRYIRIWRDTSAHAFIDKTTGGVLKTATWKAPAKGERGNIFNPDNGMDCMGPYGPAYIRGPHYKFDEA